MEDDTPREREILRCAQNDRRSSAVIVLLQEKRGLEPNRSFRTTLPGMKCFELTRSVSPSVHGWVIAARILGTQKGSMARILGAWRAKDESMA